MKTKWLHIRLEKQESRRLEKEARLQKIKVSELVRRVLNQYLAKREIGREFDGKS